MTRKSLVVKETTRYLGKWIECVEISYQDEQGHIRSWEGIHRENRADAVIIVPRLIHSGDYILIKQFRPPLDAYILEFPAGLIDVGETPEATAIRELKEETGYVGEVIHRTPRLYTSPGILSEACFYVFIEIDETLAANQNPQSSPEPQEVIEVFLQPPETIADFFKKEEKLGAVLDIKLYSFFNHYLFPSS